MCDIRHLLPTYTIFKRFARFETKHSVYNKARGYELYCSVIENKERKHVQINTLLKIKDYTEPRSQWRMTGVHRITPRNTADNYSGTKISKKNLKEYNLIW